MRTLGSWGVSAAGSAPARRLARLAAVTGGFAGASGGGRRQGTAGRPRTVGTCRATATGAAARGVVGSAGGLSKGGLSAGVVESTVSPNGDWRKTFSRSCNGNPSGDVEVRTGLPGASPSDNGLSRAWTARPGALVILEGVVVVGHRTSRPRNRNGRPGGQGITVVLHGAGRSGGRRIGDQFRHRLGLGSTASAAAATAHCSCSGSGAVAEARRQTVQQRTH